MAQFGRATQHRPPQDRSSIGERDGPSAGFTLLEMLVVVAILALVVGLVVARGPMRSASTDMRAAASEVVHALRLARGQAIASNRRVTLAMEAAGHAYRVAGAPARRLPAGITALSKPADIGFFPDGSSTGGEVMLASAMRRATVAVDWLTGRVTVSNAPP